MLSMTTVLVAACYESHHLCAFVSGSWGTWDNQGNRSIESERPGNKILRKKTEFTTSKLSKLQNNFTKHHQPHCSGLETTETNPVALAGIRLKSDRIAYKQVDTSGPRKVLYSLTPRISLDSCFGNFKITISHMCDNRSCCTRLLAVLSTLSILVL